MRVARCCGSSSNTREGREELADLPAARVLQALARRVIGTSGARGSSRREDASRRRRSLTRIAACLPFRL